MGQSKAKHVVVLIIIFGTQIVYPIPKILVFGNDKSSWHKPNKGQRVEIIITNGILKEQRNGKKTIEQLHD